LTYLNEDLPERKECRKCGEVKPLSDFWKSKEGLYGRHSQCKKCSLQRHTEWRNKNKEKVAKKSRARYLKSKYGISLKEYDTLLTEHNYCCAICGVHEDQADRGYLCVDHDHVTGKVRGLLCNKCNTGIGLLGDSFEALANAYKYLEDN